MPSAFDAIDAAASGACARAFGEDVVISPRVTRRGGQYTATPVDTERPVRTVRGVFSQDAHSDSVSGQRTGSRLESVTRVIGGRYEVWLSADQVAAVGYEIVRGDFVTIPGEPKIPSLSVVSTIPESVGDLRIILSADEPVTT